jgi:hypothetical protein
MTRSGIHAGSITRPSSQRFNNAFYHSWLLSVDRIVCGALAAAANRRSIRGNEELFRHD